MEIACSGTLLAVENNLTNKKMHAMHVLFRNLLDLKQNQNATKITILEHDGGKEGKRGKVFIIPFLVHKTR